MMKKVLSALTIAAVLFLAAPSSHAATLGLGADFAWDNYKTAVFTYDTMNGTPSYQSTDFASPRFGGSFLLGLLQRRLMINIDLDLGIHSHTLYPYNYNAANGNTSSNWEAKATFFKIGLGAGAKFHFTTPEAGKASAYAFLGVGKVFAKSKATPINETGLSVDPTTDVIRQAGIDAQTKVLSKLSSPFYMQFGIGAEFMANEAIAVGADIFGFRFEAAKAKNGAYDEALGVANEWTGEQKYINFYLYSSINVAFTIGGSSNPRGKKSKKQDSSPSNPWGAPAPTQPQYDEWGNPVVDPTPAAPPAGGGFGASGQWGTPAPQPMQPAQPVPAPQPIAPAPVPQPQPVAPAPTPAPRPSGGGGGWNSPPPPPSP